jgi:phage baseplate assembly protein W
MATTATYVGFSSVGSLTGLNLSLYDVELVKRDLLNHFGTRIGERVMRPDFGCKIWDYLYEQGVSNLDDLIIDEAKRIVSTDPRVALQGLTVYYFDNGIRVEMTLFFIGLQVTQTFSAIFEAEERLSYGQPA